MQTSLQLLKPSKTNHKNENAMSHLVTIAVDFAVFGVVGFMIVGLIRGLDRS